MPVYVPEPVVRKLPEDKELLGEYLYPLVEERAPQLAAKITGMLLEMEVKHIHNIILDSNQLNKWVTKALSILNKVEQT
jgi:polyadenylate-binding protein